MYTSTRRLPAAAFLSMVVACTHGSQEADRQRPMASTSAAPPAAASSAPSPAPSPSSQPIVVSVDAVPSDAKIMLDDVVLASNPYEAERPRDGRTHVIRFEAPGYEPQSSSVTFSESLHMHVELAPLASAQPGARHRHHARPATPSP
jgi:hypothetical protein